MAELHRLRASQLQLNEPLPWDVFDRSGQLLLRRGYVLQRDAQIERLLEHGMFVDAAAFRAHADALATAAKHVFDPIVVWRAVQGGLVIACLNPPRDGSLQERVESLARQVLELCARHSDLALAGIKLLEFRRYPLAHSLHVAVLAVLLARRGDFDENSQLSLCCAALTQNIGMFELQQLLYHQKEPLSPEQRQIVDQHPMTGARTLQDCGVLDQEWLRAVLEHHEHPNGSGYPRHVSNPSMAALLIHTCDVYAAMISGRAYRKSMLAPDAAKKMYLEMAHGADNPFASLLIKEVGMYPPGTYVRLANGELGVVMARNRENASLPVIAVIINAKGMRNASPVRRNSAEHADYKVVAVMPVENQMMAVNFEQVWCR